MRARRIVVVGNGMAGARLVDELLQRDRTLSVTVVGAEQQPAYNRVLLSDVLAGKRQSQDIALPSVPDAVRRLGELVTSVAEHPQRIQLTVRRQDTKGLGAHRDHRDRMRVQRVGLAVVAGVEQPHPGSELGRHVHHVLAGLQQPLRQRTTRTVAALDGPHSVRPVLGVGPHRGVAGLVGAEPARPEQPLVAVDDLDRGRHFMGINPDDDLLHLMLLTRLEPIGRRGGQCYYEQGSPLWSHASSTVPGGLQTECEPHPHTGAAQ